MFVSTWTLRLTTWSLTQCADGVHREAQQRMFSPDAASGKVSDPQQLNRHKDEALLASVDFRLPFRKKNSSLSSPPASHSFSPFSLAPPCLQARPVRLHPSLLQCGHIHRGFLSLPSSAPLLRVLPAGLRAGRSAAPSCVSMQRAQGSGGIGQMENKAAAPAECSAADDCGHGQKQELICHSALLSLFQQRRPHFDLLYFCFHVRHNLKRLW